MSVEPLQCSICMRLYNDDKGCVPHIIECGHTFCHDCITRRNPFECPVCGHMHDESVSPAPHNFSISDLPNSSVFDLSGIPKCDNCGKRPGVLHCCLCSANLCMECDSAIHSFRVFSQHSRSLLRFVSSRAASQGLKGNISIPNPLDELLVLSSKIKQCDSGSGIDSKSLTDFAEKCHECSEWLKSENAIAMAHGSRGEVRSVETSLAALQEALDRRGNIIQHVIELLQQRAVKRCDEQCAAIQKAFDIIRDGLTSDSDKAFVDGAASALPFWSESVRMCLTAVNQSICQLTDSSLGQAGVLQCNNAVGLIIKLKLLSPGHLKMYLEEAEAESKKGLDEGLRLPTREECLFEVQRKLLSENEASYRTVYCGCEPSFMLDTGAASVYCYRARRTNKYTNGPWGPTLFCLVNDDKTAQQLA